MKKYSILTTVLLTCIGVMSFSYVIKEIQKPIPEMEIKPIKEYKVSLNELVNPIIDIDQTDEFLDAIGHYESSNRYKIVNRWGYMGKYQFHRKTLKSLGYNVSRKEFLNSPLLQEQAMMDLLRSNKKSLGSRIHKWEGMEIKGRKITESGILAATHLGGVGNIINFMENGEDFKDGNGTSIVRYLTLFSGYNINLE